MFYTNLISSFFLFVDESDPSIDYNHPEYKSKSASEYNDESLRFAAALQYLLDNINNDMSEPEITIVVYDAAKLFDRENVRAFFKRVYNLISRSDNGPRLPTFINLMGPQEFVIMMISRMNDPFNLSN